MVPNPGDDFTLSAPPVVSGFLKNIQHLHRLFLTCDCLLIIFTQFSLEPMGVYVEGMYALLLFQSCNEDPSMILGGGLRKESVITEKAP